MLPCVFLLPLIFDIYPAGIYLLAASVIFFLEVFLAYIDVLWLRQSTFHFFFGKVDVCSFAPLTLATFLLIEMTIGKWSELRPVCVAHSVHKSNDGLACV